MKEDYSKLEGVRMILNFIFNNIRLTVMARYFQQHQCSNLKRLSFADTKLVEKNSEMAVQTQF